MDRKICLILDSGFGGVDILKDLLYFSNFNLYIYFHDGYSFPYGNKDPFYLIENIKRYILYFLQTYPSITQIILGCNTASLYTISHIKKVLPDIISIYGISPSIRLFEKVHSNYNREIACIATENTLSHPNYKQEVLRLKKKILLFIIFFVQTLLAQ